MSIDFNKKAPFYIYAIFTSIAILTGFIPYSVGGVVSSFFWFTPLLILDKYWVKNKLKLLCFTLIIWLFSILLGGLISKTWIDIRFPF